MTQATARALQEALARADIPQTLALLQAGAIADTPQLSPRHLVALLQLLGNEKIQNEFFEAEELALTVAALTHETIINRVKQNAPHADELACALVNIYLQRMFTGSLLHFFSEAFMEPMMAADADRPLFDQLGWTTTDRRQFLNDAFTEVIEEVLYPEFNAAEFFENMWADFLQMEDEYRRTIRAALGQGGRIKITALPESRLRMWFTQYLPLLAPYSELIWDQRSDQITIQFSGDAQQGLLLIAQAACYFAPTNLAAYDWNLQLGSPAGPATPEPINCNNSVPPELKADDDPLSISLDTQMHGMKAGQLLSLEIADMLLLAKIEAGVITKAEVISATARFLRNHLGEIRYATRIAEISIGEADVLAPTIKQLLDAEIYDTAGSDDDPYTAGSCDYLHVASRPDQSGLNRDKGQLVLLERGDLGVPDLLRGQHEQGRNYCLEMCFNSYITPWSLQVTSKAGADTEDVTDDLAQLKRTFTKLFGHNSSERKLARWYGSAVRGTFTAQFSSEAELLQLVDQVNPQELDQLAYGFEFLVLDFAEFEAKIDSLANIFSTLDFNLDPLISVGLYPQG